MKYESIIAAAFMALFFVLVLAGCLGLGVQNMTEGQIKATEGMATCTDVYTMYGKGRSVTVHSDAVKKGVDSTNEVVIGADCTVTIRSSGTSKPAPPVVKP